jgi:hypothetical protein
MNRTLVRGGLWFNYPAPSTLGGSRKFCNAVQRWYLLERPPVIRGAFLNAGEEALLRHRTKSHKSDF